MSPWLRIGLLLLGTAVLVGFLGAADVPQLWLTVRTARVDLLLGAGLLVCAGVAVKALRWRAMVRHFSAVRLSLPDAMWAIVAGVAAGSLAPGRTVEFAKPMLLRARHDVPMASSTAAVLVERLMDGSGFLILFGGSLLFVPSSVALLRAAAVAAGLLVLGAAGLLLVPHRLSLIGRRLAAVLPIADSLRLRLDGIITAVSDTLLTWRAGRGLGMLIGLSAAVAMLEAIRLMMVFAAVGVDISLPGAMLAFGAANLVAIATLVPGGVGVTEASVAAIAAVLLPAAPRSALAAGALLDRMISYYLLVLLGSSLLVLVPIVAGAKKGGDEETPRQGGSS